MYECAARNMEKQTFVRKSQIRKFFRSLSQISIFLWFASPQIENTQIFRINPQMANPQISTKNYLIKVLFVRRKSLYLRTCGSFKLANHKKIGSAISKSAKCHICGRSPNVKLFADRPPLRRYESSLGRMLFSASPPLPAAVGIKAN